MIPWYTWVFSGVGVYLAGYLSGVLRRYFEKGLGAYKQGYYCPDSLTYFSHGPMSNDGSVHVKARRIMTLCSLRNASFQVSYPVTTRGTINRAISLSHPEMMRVVERGASGSNTLQIDGASRGRYFIVASESERVIMPGTIQFRPSPFDTVLSTLFQQRLDAGQNRDFSGTRIICRTDAVKLLVEFAPGCCPERVFPIHIAEDGTILRGEDNADYISPKYPPHNQRPFFIYRLNNVVPGSGFYLWWEWPTSIVEQAHRGEA